MKKETIMELLGLALENKSEISNDTPFEIGKAYFIRTVTYHLTGRVKEIRGNFLVLEDGAWIADSGRFMQMLQNGKPEEVEPVGDAIVNINSITDSFPWNHKLPKEQK